MKKGYFFIGLVLSIIGSFLIIHSFFTLTGYVVSEGNVEARSLSGILFFFVGLILMKKSKRGQAAVEFLMTYGWAILASVIVMGVLAYMGVFGGSFSQPTTLALSPPFYISAVSIQKLVSPENQVLGYRVGIDLYNGGGTSTQISSIEIKSSDGQILCSYEPLTPLSINSGQKEGIYLSCQDIADSMFEGDFYLHYTNSGSNLVQTSSGEIRGSVQSVVPEAVCGNELLEQGEVCELSDTNPCNALGGYLGTQSCNAQCNGYSECVSDLYCGDLIINGNEVCDGGDPLECTVDEKGEPGFQNCLVDCSGYGVCESPDGG